MTHIHSVKDTDTRFSINANTRQIKNESSRKTALMQNDHNSERFTFELPRYIEGHDMSICNQVEIHYLNSSFSDKKEFRKGLYRVDDLQISPDDTEKVICSWLISQNATQLVGKLSFRLRFKCVENSVITYAWHTAIFADIAISDGINADETFEMDYVDIIEQWNTGNYDVYGNYLGYGPNFVGMVFRRYVVGKSDNTAITPEEAFSNVKVFVKLSSRFVTENRANAILRYNTHFISILSLFSD